MALCSVMSGVSEDYEALNRSHENARTYGNDNSVFREPSIDVAKQ